MPTKAQRLKAYYESHEPGDAVEALEMMGEIEDDPILQLPEDFGLTGAFTVHFDDGSILNVGRKTYTVIA